MGYNLGEFGAGTKVRLRAAFTTHNELLGLDVPTDPTDVTVTVVRPGGATFSETWPLGAVQRDGVGSFYFDQVLDQPGTWAVEWAGTGTAEVAAGDEVVAVRPAA
jgi:hypothetical protein